MNNERNHLLDDIFREDAPSYDLLNQMLGRVRRRRRARAITRVSMVLVAMAGILTLVMNKVRSPIPGAAEIASQPSAESLNVISTVAGSVDVIASSTASVTLITTAPADVDMISDERMLVLLSPRRPMLIWRNPGDAELVFADSGTQNDVQ